MKALREIAYGLIGFGAAIIVVCIPSVLMALIQAAFTR